MKIAILIMIIVLALVGFQFFQFASSEVDQSQVSQIQSIKSSDIQRLPVGNVEYMGVYTQRISTYPMTSENVIAQAYQYYVKGQLNQAFYIKDQMLKHVEFSTGDYDLGKIENNLVLIVTSDELKTNLNDGDYLAYELDGYYMLDIQTNQTGRYQIQVDDYIIKFEFMNK